MQRSITKAEADEYLAYVLEQCSVLDGVSSRQMFGGAGLYKGGKIFGIVADGRAFLKVDDSNLQRFVAAGSKPFRPFGGRPVTMPYWEIPADVLESPKNLADWAAASLAIPAKPKKPKRPKKRKSKS